MRALLWGVTLLVLGVFVDAITIEEIMYDPQGKDNLGEYVEVHLDGEILDGWKIADRSGEDSLTLVKPGTNNFVVIVEEGSVIDAGDATVYHAGSSIGNNLNNGGDSISLIDASGGTVVAINYSKSDGASNNGKSLCRIESSWIECAPSPGRANDIRSFVPYVEKESGKNERLIKESVKTGKGASAMKRQPSVPWSAVVFFFAGLLITVFLLWWKKHESND